MWFEAERLFSRVNRFSKDCDESEVVELIRQLKKYKERLQFVTTNSSRLKSDRDKLKPGSEVEIDGNKYQLDDSLCNETRIISDAFKMNEMDALQILLTGEAQLPNFPFLTRGLTAVICYYDSHRHFMFALRNILSWDLEEISEQLKNFIEETFIQVPVFTHLLQLHNSFSVTSEFALLSHQEVNGLGGAKHQAIIRSVIEELCEARTEALFLICNKAGNKARDLAAVLYPVLKAAPLSEKFSSYYLAAWCSLIRLTSGDVLNQGSVASATIQDMIKEIRDETKWSDQSVCGTVQLVCAVSFRAMALSPADHLNISNVEVDVERIFDRAVQNLAFKFIRYGIILSDHLKSNANFVRTADYILKQVICLFDAKLVEIERNSEDELNSMDEMKAKGHPTQPIGQYTTFLASISDIYGLSEIENVAPEIKAEIFELSTAFSGPGSIELCRFMELACKSCHPLHAVAYLEFLQSVCLTRPTAAYLFHMFESVPIDQDVYVGWEQVMTALRTYEARFRQHVNVAPHFGINITAPAEVPTIPEEDLAALIAWINLAKKIADLDYESADTFAEERGWALVDVSLGVVSAPVPLPLKGALMKLLSALGKREIAASKIWNSLVAYQICSFADNGALLGLQQELEERECTSKQFDSSIGFVYLMRSLLGHGTIPDFAGPYLQYLIKSIISQMGGRSYTDVKQMWELAEVSLEAIHSILDHGFTDVRAVIKKDPHISLLGQILNDTPVCRTICSILLEDCDSYQNSGMNRLSKKASYVALKLLAGAVARHSQLRVAARAANSDLIVANLQVLLLSALRTSGDNLVDVIFTFLEQVDDLPCHAYQAMRILRELCSIRPSLQKRITELMRIRVRQLNGTFSQLNAVRTVLDFSKIQYTVQNVLDTGFDENDPLRCRGEVARMLLDIFCDAVDSDPDGPNMCFFLFGFQPNSAGQLFHRDRVQTGFHFVVDIVKSFISDDPMSLPFSAVLEPCFRLLQRLVSVDSSYAIAVLRYLRSHDLVKRLISSPSIMNSLRKYVSEESAGLLACTQMIVGDILHLAALEISFLLKNNQLNNPMEIYHLLLDRKEDVDADGNETVSNLLLSILNHSHPRFIEELDFPILEHFNAQKLHRLFDECRSAMAFGVSQYDVACLHNLMNGEIVATQTDALLVALVEREMESVLSYATGLNSIILQRGASDQLVSGCTALFNVMAVFAPVPFFSMASQLDILLDSAFALMEFASSHNGDAMIPLCSTLNRLCKAVCMLSKKEYPKITDLRSGIHRIFTPLVELLIFPCERPLQAKISLYESVLLCLNICYDNESPSSTTAPCDWLTDSIMEPSGSDDAISSTIDRFAEELSNKCANDISSLPQNLKSSPLLFLSALLREDLLGSKKVASFLSKSGMPRYLTDLLARIKIDWEALAKRDQTAVTQNKLLVAILNVMSRLSLSQPGWVALADLALPEFLAQLEVISNPPKKVFVQPTSVVEKGTASFLYGETCERVLRLCMALCAKPKWKRLSLKILDVIYAMNELLSQMLKAEIAAPIVHAASSLVKYIWDSDEASRFAIDGSSILNQLRQKSSPEPVAKQPSVPSFNTPSRLTRNLIRA